MYFNQHRSWIAGYGVRIAVWYGSHAGYSWACVSTHRVAQSYADCYSTWGLPRTTVIADPTSLTALLLIDVLPVTNHRASQLVTRTDSLGSP